MNNCILYLVNSSDEDLQDFQKSLSMLKENYLDKFPTNILVFHTHDFIPHVSYFESQFPKIKFRWEEINLDVPDYYDSEIYCKIPYCFPHPTHGKGGSCDCGHKGFTIGYRSMCRFFAGQIFKHPSLNEYKYFWRLDTDSFIISKIDFDVFKEMARNGYKYGYISSAVQYDDPKVTEGLHDFSREVFYNIDEVLLGTFDYLEQDKMFYTNFEICDINWFKNSPYIDFYNRLDKTGNFYIKRWGDAPIRYLGVKTLLPPDMIWGIQGITYQHGGIFK